MARQELADGRVPGEIRLGRLGGQDVEYLYAAMRARGVGSADIRRCATVLSRALDLARKRGLNESNPANRHRGDPQGTKWSDWRDVPLTESAVAAFPFSPDP